MCGIFSIYSKEIIKPSYFLQSLRELEYRGYDSAGVAYFQKDNLNIVKTVSKSNVSTEKDNDPEFCPPIISSSLLQLIIINNVIISG